MTPSFNQGQFIRATIDSVLSQNYPNLEYIVMDGGSTDDTINILKSYGRRLRWISRKDKGQTDAINQGLRRSTGEVMAYLNSDDIYLPGALRAVGEYYERTHADWMTGDCLVIDVLGHVSRGNWLISGYKRFLMRIYSPTTLKIFDSMLPQPSTFWSRRAYQTVGEFNPTYRYVMDYDYWLRMSSHFIPQDLHLTLSGFRSQPDSKSETSRSKLMAEGDIALRENGAQPWQIALHRLHSTIVRQIYNLLKK